MTLTLAAANWGLTCLEQRATQARRGERWSQERPATLPSPTPEKLRIIVQMLAEAGCSLVSPT